MVDATTSIKEVDLTPRKSLFDVIGLVVDHHANLRRANNCKWDLGRMYVVNVLVAELNMVDVKLNLHEDKFERRITTRSTYISFVA